MIKEDIRIIENMILDIEMNNSEWKYCEEDSYCWLPESKVKAMQNIIAKLKELEKENQELKLKNARLTDKYAKSLMGVALKELLEKWDKE